MRGTELPTEVAKAPFCGLRQLMGAMSQRLDQTALAHVSSGRRRAQSVLAETLALPTSPSMDRSSSEPGQTIGAHTAPPALALTLGSLNGEGGDGEGGNGEDRQGIASKLWGGGAMPAARSYKRRMSRASISSLSRISEVNAALDSHVLAEDAAEAGDIESDTGVEVQSGAGAEVGAAVASGEVDGGAAQ